jgi:hypothetical protein
MVVPGNVERIEVVRGSSGSLGKGNGSTGVSPSHAGFETGG